MRARTRALVCVAVVACLLVAIAATAGAGHPAAAPDRVTLAVAPEPRTLNWLVTTGGTNTDRSWIRPLLDPLAEPDASGLLHPVLLERIPTERNGDVRSGTRSVVLLRLRREARWSDGTPITCEDVAATWRTIMSDRWPTSPRTGWDRVTGVACREPAVAELAFDGPPRDLSHVLVGFPLPAHAVAGTDFRRAFRDDIPVRSGPYRLHEWRRGVGLRYRRDGGYWGGETGAPDELLLRGAGSPDAVAMLQATGDLDVSVRRLAGTLEQERRAFPKARVELLPATAVAALAFNMDRDRTADIDLRRRIARSLDRGLVARAATGDREPAQSLLAWPGQLPGPFATWAAEPAADGSATLDLAGSPLRLVAPAGRPALERAAQVVQDQLEAAGIPTELRVQAPELYFGQTLPKGAWDLMVAEVGRSADSSLRMSVTCEPAPGRTNFLRFCDAEVDRLQAELDASDEPGARRALDHRIQQRLAELVPALPLFESRVAYVVSPRVSGIVPGVDAQLVRGFAGWRVED